MRSLYLLAVGEQAGVFKRAGALLIPLELDSYDHFLFATLVKLVNDIENSTEFYKTPWVRGRPLNRLKEALQDRLLSLPLTGRRLALSGLNDTETNFLIR